MVLAIAAIGVGIFAWLKHQETVLLDQQIAAMKEEHRHGSGKKNAGTAQESADATDDGTPAAKEKKSKKNADGVERPKAKDRAGWRAYADLAGNPEFEKLTAAQARAQASHTYAMLFKSLNLAPDAQARLQDLLGQRQQAVTDAVVAARENHLKSKTAPDEFAADVSLATAPVDAQIRQILGDTAFGQLQQFQNTIPERNLVGKLQQQLMATPTPLSDDQATRLVDALAQAKATQAAASGVSTELGTHSLLAGGGVAKVTDQTLAVAQQVLTAPQVDALQQLQLDRTQQGSLDKLMKGKSATSGVDGGPRAPKPKN